MKLRDKILISIGVIIAVLIVGSLIMGSLGGARKEGLYQAPGAPTMAPSPLEEGIGLKTEEVEREEVASEVGEKVSSRLIIKMGELNIVVKNVVESAKKIIKYAQKKGGWIVKSDITEAEELPKATVTVRVPVESFDETMTYIRGLATKVNYEKSEGQDVTEEYVDLQSQLRNLEATEKQFLEIMKKAKTIDEILRVQSEVKKIRGEIERTKGRMLYLKRSAKMATITVNLALSEELLPIPPAEKWRPGYVVKRAWKGVVGVWRNISYAVINFFVWGVVWVPVVVILYGIVWWIRKPWKKK